MSLEDLRARRERIKRNSDMILENMDAIEQESLRVADVARNSSAILNDLDREFEEAVGLKGEDIKFLFLAVALQVIRIIMINEVTQIETAGPKNRNETALHEFQEKILGVFQDGKTVKERPYYASLEHIITRAGVPYDATTFLTEKSIEGLLRKDRTWDFDLESFIPTEKMSLFKGANHRFATLGHDPIVGLLFGTGNILTNTITCVNKPMMGEKVGIPVLTTNHVVVTSDFKDPRIAAYASTVVMLQHVVKRMKEEPNAVVAALIKQIIHIGTDMYTPSGIQLPGANLILTNTEVERITEIISTGDLVKISASAGLAEVINLIIGTLHSLMYSPTMSVSRELYSVRTRKIINISNAIATGSNVIWVSVNMLSGNSSAVRYLDLAGLLVLLKKIAYDKEYIRAIKEEYIFGNFREQIRGKELDLKPINW